MRPHGASPMSHVMMDGREMNGSGMPYGGPQRVAYQGQASAGTLPASQNAGVPGNPPGPNVSGSGPSGANGMMYGGPSGGQNVMMGGGAPAPNPRHGKVINAAEQVWMQIASTANLMGDGEAAQNALELILRHNPSNYQAVLRLGDIFHNQQQYMQAAEVYQRILTISEASAGAINPAIVGSAYSSLAHCYLLLDELPKAFHAYQQALGFPGANKDSTLWFGIGLLYDRYGADEHALEAFTAVLKIEGFIGAPSHQMPTRPPSSLIREVYYRVGRLLRNRKQFNASLECFKFIQSIPPPPLTSADVSLQSAITMDAQGDQMAACHVLEQLISSVNTAGSGSGSENAMSETVKAALTRAKAYLGWIQFQREVTDNKEETNPGLVLLRETVEADPSDALAWYYLGRAYFMVGNFGKSYESYQEAVYRDGQNASFWNSIGVLYLETRQYRDALDAFSRAIQQNSSIPEIWWNLGLLYELCSNQLSDAVDAYQRAVELASESSTYMERLTLIKDVLANGSPAPAPPTESFEIDPLPWMMRPILLGSTQIPPQKATLPPSTMSIMSSVMAASSNPGMAPPNMNANPYVRMPPLPGPSMRMPPPPSMGQSMGPGPMSRPPPPYGMPHQGGGPGMFRPPPSSIPRHGQMPYSLSLTLPQPGMQPMPPRFGPPPTQQQQRAYIPR